jgi:hypothetical protein
MKMIESKNIKFNCIDSDDSMLLMMKKASYMLLMT